MGENKVLSTTLANSEGKCAQKELDLDRLPGISGYTKQLSSGLRDKFKYNHPESHLYSKGETRGNCERMTVAAISKEGAPCAC